MHNTSIENIHKVIDPLFMDDLKAAFDSICGIRQKDVSATPQHDAGIFCTSEQAAKIEKTALAILDARAKYSDSSLADLYDETLMPLDLRKAHRENDKAVMAAYGFKQGMTESEIVAELFKLYENLTKAQ